MEAPILRGDTVRLRSGGPLMTVENIQTNQNDRTITLVHCIWFWEGAERRSVFKDYLLMKEPPLEPIANV